MERFRLGMDTLEGTDDIQTQLFNLCIILPSLTGKRHIVYRYFIGWTSIHFACRSTVHVHIRNDEYREDSSANESEARVRRGVCLPARTVLLERAGLRSWHGHAREISVARLTALCMASLFSALS